MFEIARRRGALMLAAVLGGCVTVGAQQTESQLSAAGFVRHPADTPQKVAKLQALPQNTIVYTQRKSGNFYIYAGAYQQYQQLRAANNIAQMQETTAMLNAESAMNWGGAWGPEVPGWY